MSIQSFSFLLVLNKEAGHLNASVQTLSLNASVPQSQTRGHMKDEALGGQRPPSHARRALGRRGSCGGHGTKHW